jgi:hypothetical protein
MKVWPFGVALRGEVCRDRVADPAADAAHEFGRDRLVGPGRVGEPAVQHDRAGGSRRARSTTGSRPGRRWPREIERHQATNRRLQQLLCQLSEHSDE